MKSIDTFYNNNFFRSRLEARWAVFFDQMNIKYEYEPEGFRNQTGDKYLPDFYLPNTSLRGDNLGVYIEIKPDSYEQDDIPQSAWFNKPLVLFRGLPNKHMYGYWQEFEGGFELYLIWDNSMMIWVCSKCDASKIDFEKNTYCHKCNHKGHKKTQMFLAAKDAVMARFEYNDFKILGL